MTFLIGIMAILFRLTVPFWFWVLVIAIDLVQATMCSLDKRKQLPNTVPHIYPIILLLNANIDLFSKFGYHRIPAIENIFLVLTIIGMVLGVLSIIVASWINRK